MLDLSFQQELQKNEREGIGSLSPLWEVLSAQAVTPNAYPRISSSAKFSNPSKINNTGWHPGHHKGKIFQPWSNDWWQQGGFCPGSWQSLFSSICLPHQSLGQLAASSEGKSRLGKHCLHSRDRDRDRQWRGMERSVLSPCSVLWFTC